MRLCATMRTTFPAESQNIHQMCVPICRLPKTCFGISSKDRNGLFGQPDLEGLKKLWSDCTCVRRIVPIFWGAGSSTGAKMDPIVLDRSLTDDPVWLSDPTTGWRQGKKMVVTPATPLTLCPLVFLVLPQHLAPLGDHGVQFAEAFRQALADDGAGRLQVPRRGGAQLPEGQGVLHLAGAQRVPQVLLIGHHQHGDALVLRQPGDLVQFRLGLLHALAVHRVHHEDHAVGAAGVRTPQGAQFLLASHIPKVEGRRPPPPAIPQGHFDLLRVETLCGDRVDKLVESQPIQHGGLAGAIQSQDDDVQGLERQGAAQFRESVAHLGDPEREVPSNSAGCFSSAVARACGGGGGGGIETVMHHESNLTKRARDFQKDGTLNRWSWQRWMASQTAGWRAAHLHKRQRRNSYANFDNNNNKKNKKRLWLCPEIQGLDLMWERPRKIKAQSFASRVAQQHKTCT